MWAMNSFTSLRFTSIATAGCEVRLHDIDPARVAAALARIENSRFGLRRAVERNKLTAAEAEATLRRIAPAATLEAACADAELVVEAVPEDLALKCRLFRALDEAAPAGTVHVKKLYDGTELS